MALYFFDSSAIVKRYVSETGTTWVTSLADPAAGNRIYLALIIGVEIVSAFTRRRRGGSLSATDLVVAMSDFRNDFANLYLTVEINEALVKHAMTLAETHALCGYDAVQLAAALEIYDERLSLGLSLPQFISADAALNAAAVLEGLMVDEPNLH